MRPPSSLLTVRVQVNDSSFFSDFNFLKHFLCSQKALCKPILEEGGYLTKAPYS